jgi:hypothetical protein
MSLRSVMVTRIAPRDTLPMTHANVVAISVANATTLLLRANSSPAGVRTVLKSKRTEIPERNLMGRETYTFESYDPLPAGRSPLSRGVRFASRALKAMSAATTADSMIHVLRLFQRGSLEARLDGEPFAALDANRRTMSIQLDPVARQGRKILAEGQFSVWKARGIPGALARAGWYVSLREGSDELVGMGYGASALTGHMHVHPTALGRLWKLV